MVEQVVVCTVRLFDTYYSVHVHSELLLIDQVPGFEGRPVVPVRQANAGVLDTGYGRLVEQIYTRSCRCVPLYCPSAASAVDIFDIYTINYNLSVTFRLIISALSMQTS